MPQYYIWTIGCQMNKAESERICGYLELQGYKKTDTADEADVIILNTCVVRKSAENRCIGRISTLKAIKRSFPEVTMAVTGCMVDSDTNSLKNSFPFVDYFFKPGEYPPWLDKLTSGHVLPRTSSPIYYLPIIKGCNNFCTYCIVPYRRGREQSRSVEDIIEEVKAMVGQKVKEVVLLGQNVNSYGHDLDEKPDFADLLVELNCIEELARIRFLTNHPKDMSPRLIKKIARLDKVCKDISLPVQSGNNDILKAMGRGYTADQYRNLIRDLRNRITDLSISTDIIVGFPSETEAMFMETYNLLSEIRFDVVHVAAYSTRPGTIAARTMKDDISPSIKSQRLQKVELLQKQISTNNNHSLIGSRVEVLVEGRKKGQWWGRSRNGKLVFFSNENTDLTGNLVEIDIESAGPWALRGNIATTRTSEIKEGKWIPT